MIACHHLLLHKVIEGINFPIFFSSQYNIRFACKTFYFSNRVSQLYVNDAHMPQRDTTQPFNLFVCFYFNL